MIPPLTPHDEPQRLEDLEMIEQRQGPGRRATDYAATIEVEAIRAVKGTKKAIVATAAAAGAAGAGATAILGVFGLSIGGAREVPALRRADSALVAHDIEQDSVIAANRRAIAYLKQDGENKMTVLCIIAENLKAATGGLCPRRDR